MNTRIRERERCKRSKVVRRGVTLIGVMVALTVIALTIPGVFKILQISSESTANIKDKLAAYNLGREGMEVARNVLYTNLLRYGGKQCWNMKQSPCDDANKLSGSYTIKNYLEYGEMRTSLEEKSSAFYLSAGDTSNPEKKKLNPEYVVGLQKIGSEAFMTNDTLNAEETKFHRKIDIDYDESNTDRMLIKSTVAWVRKNELKEIKMESVFNKK